MRQLPQSRPFLHCFRAGASVGLGLLFVVLALRSTPAATAQPLPSLPVDPVDALQQTLRKDRNVDRFKEEDLRSRIIEMRKNALEQEAAAVRTLGDMVRALLLPEWEDPTLPLDVLAVNRAVEKQLIARFEKAAEAEFTSSDPYRQRAAANLIGGMAERFRADKLRSDRTRQALAALDPKLSRLLESRDLGVREAAARAMGQIGPPIQQGKEGPPNVPAVEALGKLLTATTVTAAEQRAAAAALTQIIGLSLQDFGDVKTGLAYQTVRGNLIAIAPAVVRALIPGLVSPDSQVRRLSAEGIHLAAVSLTQLLPDPPRAKDRELLPPPTREWSSEEQMYVAAKWRDFDAQKAELRALRAALEKATPILAQLLQDRSLEVRLTALRTAEEMGVGRDKLLTYVSSLPPRRLVKPPPKEPMEKDGEEKKGAEEKKGPAPDEEESEAAEVGPDGTRTSPDPYIGPFDALENALASLRKPVVERMLTDPRPEARLAAAETLEAMGPEAGTEAWALARATSDPDRFVRWVAARSLGRMGTASVTVWAPKVLVQPPAGPGCFELLHDLVAWAPAGTEKAVPDEVAERAVVPALARLLSDQDLDLRVAAAKALEQYGPRAYLAIPMLAWSVNAGDPDIRMAAIRALTGIGVAAAPEGLPAMTRALHHTDPRVRIEAAQALARYGAFTRLLSSLESERKITGEQQKALNVLRQTGQKILPDLRTHLNDSDTQVRQTVGDAFLDFTVAMRK